MTTPVERGIVFVCRCVSVCLCCLHNTKPDKFIQSGGGGGSSPATRVSRRRADGELKIQRAAF